MNWFLNLFRRRFLVTFHLTGGQSISIRCREYSFTTSTVTGRLTGYEISGLPDNHKPIHISLDDVSAVERRRVWL